MPLISNDIHIPFAAVVTKGEGDGYLPTTHIFPNECFQVVQRRQTGPPQDFKLPGVLPLLCSPSPYKPLPHVRVCAPLVVLKLRAQARQVASRAASWREWGRWVCRGKTKPELRESVTYSGTHWHCQIPLWTFFKNGSQNARSYWLVLIPWGLLSYQQRKIISTFSFDFKCRDSNHES